jgi:hypothetical protein
MELLQNLVKFLPITRFQNQTKVEDIPACAILNG